MKNDNSLTDIREQLETKLGKKLLLKINNNRSTMLSVKWAPDHTQVSMHKMFLEAPTNVMEELACYLKREHQRLTPSVKAYIEKGLQTLDYSHELNLAKLDHAGKVFDLKNIYERLNGVYFENQLKLQITWFAKPKNANRSRISLGLFSDPLKLIKINRLLDHSRVPGYVIDFVVYHEMLHAASPAYVDSKGQRHIHSQDFKILEKQFEYFGAAQNWIKQNREKLFNNKL